MNRNYAHDGFRPMTRTMRTNNARKIAAGLYEVDTVQGIAEVMCIDTEWYITYPGSSRADHVAATLQDAQRQIAAWSAAH